MKLLLGIVLIVLALVCCTYGATFQSKTDPEMVHGKLVFYCEYKGLKLLSKSKFKDYEDCVQCTCGKGGMLSCHDLGYTVSYDKEQSECSNVLIGCKNKWVLKDDTTKKCPRRKIPQASAVGK